MITIDYDTAVETVKSLYSGAKDPLLNIELEATKGQRNYRPYACAFKFILAEYRRIIKADEVTFEYNLEAAKNLLVLQKQLDLGDTIPEGQTVDDLLKILNDVKCQTCETTPSGSTLGIMII